MHTFILVVYTIGKWLLCIGKNKKPGLRARSKNIPTAYNSKHLTALENVRREILHWKRWRLVILNQALIRQYHKTLSLEELNHIFAGAKYFSTLDAKSGNWSGRLDIDSKQLLTFQTPVGRNCFQRLPFGQCLSQDIFQMEMDHILQDCKGAVGIANDITVDGATEKEHDWHLEELM